MALCKNGSIYLPVLTYGQFWHNLSLRGLLALNVHLGNIPLEKRHIAG